MNRRKKLIYGLLGLMIIVGIAVSAIFTTIDNQKFTDTLASTLSFGKNKIINYDNGISNDRVKSLVRLLDKTEELCKDMVEYSSFNQSDLDDYVREQRLTGVILLDENLNIERSSTISDDTAFIWQDILAKDYINDLLSHSNATYTEQVNLGGVNYDYALVSRLDHKGLLLTYVQKTDSYGEDDNDSLASLFQDYQLEMGGVIIVESDGSIVSSNNQDLLGISFNDYTKNNLRVNKDGIFVSKIDTHTWYGKQEKVGNYILTVMFPQNKIFIERSMAFLLYCGLAVLVFMVTIIVQNNYEKNVLKQNQKRLSIITALGYAYTSITLLDVKNGHTELIKAPDGKEEVCKKENQLERIKSLIDPEYVDAYNDFIDMNNICQRLKKEKSISITTKTIDNKWYTILVVPQRKDEQGNILTVLLACRDITIEKEEELAQERKLKEALAYAERANSAKTNFLNSVSHDIRTPMNAIVGYTSLADSHIDNKVQVKDYLRKINTSCQHLLSLINDILDMSRIESGIVKIDENVTHLPDIIHDLRSIISGNLIAKKHNLTINIDNIVHEDIITDKLRLNQVLLNIVNNAIKFTPDKGTISIDVKEKPSLKKGYATYIFSVKDNGIGMSKEFQEDIFKAFAREKTVTENGIQGTGLGMSISKNIVDMMGGDIKVNSKQGEGSEFIVTIDFKVVEKKPEYKINKLQNARALVVDEDEKTCASVSKMLTEFGLEAVSANDGKKAVSMAIDAYRDNKAFDVYIVDYNLKDLNGLKVIKDIKKETSGKSMYILMAYDYSDALQVMDVDDITAFMSKPIFKSELYLTLVQEKTITKKDSVVDSKRYQGKKILLVEDNELNAEIATTILEEAGLKVDLVNDGIDAVEAMANATEDQYDAILMDVQMPKMDGYTATREIRTLSDNKKANIPIIAMTANAFDQDKMKAINAGMNGHISKPISLEAILAALDKAFDK